MFEEYLQDAYEFLAIGSSTSAKLSEKEARRYYRGAVFCASGAIEAFVNYLADSFAKAGSLSEHEICFLNDRVLVFSMEKGLQEKAKYHPLDQGD